jgi:hypothetical protein
MLARQTGGPDKRHRFEIQRRELVLNGRAFDSAGAYEKILGTLRFAVDPTT